MAKGQGVVYIKYVDNNISSGMNGHAVNIFFDVYDFDVDKQSKTVYIDIRNGNYSKITLIPLSNIGLIEYFPIKADFYKAWILMNNKSCGHDFERIKFWPFESKKSEIQIYPRYGNRDGSYLLYTSVIGIQRKWNHDIKGNELYIRVIDFWAICWIP